MIKSDQPDTAANPLARQFAEGYPSTSSAGRFRPATSSRSSSHGQVRPTQRNG